MELLKFSFPAQALLFFTVPVALIMRRLSAPLRICECSSDFAQENLDSRVLSPSVKTPFTSQASEVGLGSSIESTEGKNLSLADTSQIIHSIRSLSATTKTENCCMLPRSVTGSYQTRAVK
jgi:hypothetical protein